MREHVHCTVCDEPCANGTAHQDLIACVRALARKARRLEERVSHLDRHMAGVTRGVFRGLGAAK